MKLIAGCFAVLTLHALREVAAGEVSTCGSNNNGQIGDGSTTTQPVPTPVPSLVGQQIKAIATGGSHSGALTTSGSLFMWGYNYYGQVGDGGIGYRPNPQLIDVGGQVIASFSLGDMHTSALTNAGDLYLWGSNFYCQVGDGTLKNQKQRPVLVSVAAQKVKTMGLGGCHSGAVTTNGLYLWGRNNYGQIGLGAAYYWQPTPTLISVGGEVVASIALGAFHSGAVTVSGHLYMWGSNINGQLGDGTVTDRYSPLLVNVGGASAKVIQSISLAGYRSSAVTNGGALYMWGLNDHGQIGDNTLKSKIRPTLISMPCNVKNVTLGPSHSGALCASGDVYTWGWNVDGRLGDGTKVDRLVPTLMSISGKATAIAVGGAHSEVLVGAAPAPSNNPSPSPASAPSPFNGGNAYFFGSNTNGQVGDSTTVSPKVAPVLLSALSSQVTAVVAGGSHSGALTSGGSVYMWGYNYYGQVGDGGVGYRANPTLISVGGQVAASLALGEMHSSALTSAGDLYLWGSNFYAQIGDKTFNNMKQSPIRITVVSGQPMLTMAMGGGHSGAVAADGKLYMWGRNNYGQLGLGSTYNWLATPTVVPVGGEIVASISLGALHSGAVTANGNLYTWGSNQNGQIGDGSTTMRPSPVLVYFGGDLVKSIAFGGDHSGALTQAGSLVMWGLNDHGQVGDSTTTTQPSPIPVAVGGRKVAQISSGPSHTAALATDGAVFMWGYNVDGRLGDGTAVDKLCPTQVVATGAVAVAAGGSHSAVLISGTLTSVAAVNIASSTEATDTASEPTHSYAALYGLLALVPVCGLVGGFFLVRWLQRPKEVTMEIDQPANSMVAPCEMTLSETHDMEWGIVPCPTLEPGFIRSAQSASQNEVSGAH